jgi:hypothetical protein
MARTVVFTDQDMEDTVEPVMEIMDALADAVLVTIMTTRIKGVTPRDGKALAKSYRELADKILRFAKEDY